MSMITYFVAIGFVRDDDGLLVSEEPIAAPSADRAILIAANLSDTKAGAIAFARTGDPDLGTFQPATILARYGDVPSEME